MATSLSLSIIPILSLAPLIHYMISSPIVPPPTAHTGYIAWQFALPISIGVAIFAGLGLRASKKIPVIYLRIIFATLSIVIFIKTVYDILNP
jgi:uncharacterized membrane protein YfcA